MSSPTRLNEATKETLRCFVDLQTALNQKDGTVKPSVLLLLHQQLEGLRALHKDMSTGAPTRRAWSYGQSAVPVLHIILQSVSKADPVAEVGLIVSRCREQLDALGSALLASAEGR